jgi:hypothetical protein
MPPIPANVNDCFEVRLQGTIEGQRTENVWHFICVGDTADVELNLIKVFVDCFIDNLLPVLSSAWAFERVVWKRVSPTLSIDQIYQTDLPANGAGAATSLPSYASLLYSERTELPGRSGRGRKYIAGIPENATIGSKLDPTHAFWIGAVAFAACVLAAFVHPDPAGGTDIFDIAVLSRKIGGNVAPYSAPGFHAVTQLIPVAELATTRSRKLGRGL